MTLPRLRHLLLKSYFPLAFVAAIILLILDKITAPVVAQVRTVTVTVYVTLIQTVAIPVPVTYYVTVASVATSFITFATTAVSISLGTVTLLNTVSLWHTVTTAAGGILGPTPSMLFGNYSDAAMIGGGALVGAATALASSRLFPRLGASEIKPEEGSGNTDKLFADLDSIAKAKDLDKLDEAQKDLSKLNEDKAKLNQDKSRLTVEGTAGVALLEEAKDAITTFVSNVTSIIDKTKDAAKKIARDMA
ncbi:hypothetical protein MUP05_04290 [Candidatus Bathyarchaeota archaeon]|nr:hypothetical protein [Candidatus Bathyarchaeota archaeon]